MFSRSPRHGFAWRLHLLRDIASAAPTNGAASILAACAPCEGWAKVAQVSEANYRSAAAAGFVTEALPKDIIPSTG